jgi:predicted acyltransferase
MTRYLALDAFRGLTIAFMILVNTPGTWSHVYSPLLHAKWHGATVTDFVFPFFLFIIGSAMFFSFKKSNFSASPVQFVSIVKRGVIMFFLGLMLNTIPFTTDISDWRIMGVLQRIGLAYIFASSIVLLCNRKGIFILSALLLALYWWLLMSVGAGALTLEGNIVRQFDLAILGASHMYSMQGVFFDPEGLLSTIPAIVSMLLGFEVTRHLTSIENKKNSVIQLVVIGVVGVLIGLLLNEVMPINKSLWTPSYVIFTTGWACLVLTCFVWLIDIKQCNKAVAPLLVYGTNPLFVYMLSGLVVTCYLNISMGDTSLYGWLYQQLALLFEATFASFIFALLHVIFFWFVSLKLYQKNIVIKI